MIALALPRPLGSGLKNAVPMLNSRKDINFI